MAKEKKYSGPGKDLGTVKEVHCSGVSVTTTGAKIFIVNVAKGDRIIEIDGKKQIAPKVKPDSSTSVQNSENKGNTQNTASSTLSLDLDNDGDTESNKEE